MASPSAPSASSGRARFNIGQVLDQLRPDYPGVTIPKIRFLEDKGLIKPERTPSGYRKFSHDDVDRLRYVLRMQRDHYLPLKVIGEHLADVHPRPRGRRTAPRHRGGGHAQLPSCPEKKTKRYLPICTSSPSLSWTRSMRSRLT